MTSLPRSATRAEAGFVLVAVLWILAALATLASIYSSYTVNTADRIAGGRRPRAGGGLNSGRRRNGGLPPTRAPREGQTGPGRLRHARGAHWVAVRFRSEAARIDLNAAPADLLAGLFTAVGVDSSRAETFAERIVGWRTKARASADAKHDAKPGRARALRMPRRAAALRMPSRATDATNAQGGDAAKEDKLYSEQHMPYPPRHAPFDNALELSLLPGISLAVVERVLPFVTVFSGRAEVDVSSADPTVLSALPEMTPQILGAVLNARVNDPGDGRALLALLGPAKAHATADRSKAFRASISVEFDNGRRVHAEVVFRLKDQGDKDKGDSKRTTKRQRQGRRRRTL